METAAFLSKISGFETIDQSGLEAIAETVKIDIFEPGRRILRRGEPGDKMFIIREGEVQIPVVDEGGETRVVARLGPRGIFGEMALLTGEPRVADVLAETRVETLSIAREDLEPLMKETPALARLLSGLLGKRLEEGQGIKSVGKYQLIGPIGQGSSAKVFGAIHPSLNRVVAIKMLSHSLVYDSKFRERFLDEARTIASLNHPNIVQVYDMEEAYATIFIVMERIAGEDLQAVLTRRGPLAPDEAMRILRQIAEALAFAHGRGIIHRDVKPGNCAVDDYGRVRLMDFGIAQRLQKKKPGQRVATVEGSPRYMAPEAALGEVIDGRADIYSLAVMAYEMVVGQPLFEESTINRLLVAHVRKKVPDIQKVKEGLPAGLAEFIRRGLVKKPEDRIADWNEILALLGGPSGAVAMTPRLGVERIIRVRYPESMESVVDEAIEAFKGSLRGLDGVGVASATLKNESSGGRATREDETAKTLKVGGFRIPFIRTKKGEA